MYQAPLFGMEPDDSASMEEARQLIGPRADLLCGCWINGFDEWLTQVTADGRSRLTGRSRSNCVNDFAVENAKSLLGGQDGIEFDMALGFFKVYIDDRIVLRFKRLNRDRLARNVKTDQQIAYYRNQPISGIRNWCTRLTIGYVLNPAETEIADILATCQFGQRNLVWWFSILGDADLRRIPVAPAPQPDAGPQIEIRPIKKDGREAMG